MWWEVEEQRLIALGAIRYAAPHECSHMCPAFCVPKDQAGVFRLVIDERPLNKYVKKRVFRMDALRDFLAQTVSGDRAIRVDIADAYYHLGISSAWQRYFGFCINGQYYVLTAAAMGYTLSPWLFTALMRVPLRFLRTGGKPPRSPGFPPTPAMAWLDDLLCLVQSSQHAAHLRLFFLSLGFRLHDTKCVWEPQGHLEYLGFNLDLVRGRVLIPERKLRSISSLARELLPSGRRRTRRVGRRHLEIFCGVANSLALALPAAGFFLRPLYNILKEQSGGRSVALSRAVCRSLHWWARLATYTQGPPHDGRSMWQRPVMLTLHTDAATDMVTRAGWGGVLQWGAPDEKRVAGVFGAAEMEHLHISTLELMAITRALDHFKLQCANTHLAIYSDSAVVVAVLTRWTTKSQELYRALRDFLHLIWTLQITYVISHIPGVTNTIADALSRQSTPPPLPLLVRHLPLRTLEDLPRFWGDRECFYFLPPYRIQLALRKLAAEGGRGRILLPLHVQKTVWWSIIQPAVRHQWKLRWPFATGSRMACLVDFVFLAHPQPRRPGTWGAGCTN